MLTEKAGLKKIRWGFFWGGGGRKKGRVGVGINEIHDICTHCTVAHCTRVKKYCTAGLRYNKHTGK